MYGSYGIFGDIQTATEYNEQLTNYTYNESASVGSGNLDETYSYDDTEGQNFIDLIVGFGSFATFGEIDNTFARLILNLTTTICFIVIGYLIYTFIRDWVPLIG